MTSSAAAQCGHLAMIFAQIGRFQKFRCAATNLRRLIPSTLTDSYRPELHYMRGPGPKWRQRHTAT
jgi:hypothetical protein